MNRNEIIKTTWSLQECFHQMRMDTKTHCGGGDIRLTESIQSDICDLVERQYLKHAAAETEGDVVTLEDENKRLREALIEIRAELTESTIRQNANLRLVPMIHIKQAVDIASKALAGGEVK